MIVVYSLLKIFYEHSNNTKTCGYQIIRITTLLGGELKVFERKGGKLKRIGTADENLNIYKKKIWIKQSTTMNFG